MMDGLRWLLLFVGLLVIAGVYLYSRREPKKPVVEPGAAERQEPVLVAPSEVEPIVDADDESEPAFDAEPDPAESVPQKIVTLRIVARDGGSFQGDELILTMRGIGLRHGKFGIYHRYDGADEDRTIFSAASLVEPGSFDIDNIKEQKIPGISLFMILPGPLDGVEAFDLMIAAAHALGSALNGELLDETGSTLSIQRERYMREEIIQYQTSNMVG
jgi:cell division protein ZipA